MTSKYGSGKTVNLTFGAAVDRVTQELQKEGFGVLTDIDVQATLKKKAQCGCVTLSHPGCLQSASGRSRARRRAPIGLLLPCNVVGNGLRLLRK